MISQYLVNKQSTAADPTESVTLLPARLHAAEIGSPELS
jgi:hypothetical protein